MSDDPYIGPDFPITDSAPVHPIGQSYRDAVRVLQGRDDHLPIDAPDLDDDSTDIETLRVYMSLIGWCLILAPVPLTLLNHLVYSPR